MNHKLLVALAAILIAAMVSVGCKKKTESVKTEETTAVKPMDDYRAEAEKEITSENAEEALKSLEKEIADDE